MLLPKHKRQTNKTCQRHMIGKPGKTRFCESDGNGKGSITICRRWSVPSKLHVWELFRASSPILGQFDAENLQPAPCSGIPAEHRLLERRFATPQAPATSPWWLHFLPCVKWWVAASIFFGRLFNRDPCHHVNLWRCMQSFATSHKDIVHSQPTNSAQHLFSFKK